MNGNENGNHCDPRDEREKRVDEEQLDWLHRVCVVRCDDRSSEWEPEEEYQAQELWVARNLYCGKNGSKNACLDESRGDTDSHR